MNDQKRHRSIKNYLVFPSFQLKLAGLICFLIFICVFFHGGLLYYLLSKKIVGNFSSGHTDLRVIWEMLRPAVIVSNGTAFVTISILVFLVSIFTSHKLLGPMLKISGQVKKLSSGKLNSNSIKLREGDEGNELCNSINELQRSYKEKFEKIICIKNSLPENDSTRKSLEEALKEIEV